jgi:hypothetical protein
MLVKLLITMKNFYPKGIKETIGFQKNKPMPEPMWRENGIS